MGLAVDLVGVGDGEAVEVRLDARPGEGDVGGLAVQAGFGVWAFIVTENTVNTSAATADETVA